MDLCRFVDLSPRISCSGSYRWTVGGKTGFTNRAGRCLVASASRGGRRLVAVALGSPNAFPDVRALFDYGFSKFVRVRLAQRGQPVSVAPGRPAAFQAAADADALVRLDQLDQVRLALPQGSAAGPASAWFTGAGQRLVSVRLAQLQGTGAGPDETPATPHGSERLRHGRDRPRAGNGRPRRSTPHRRNTGQTLAGPPGAPAPAINPFLRREPP